MFIITRIIPKRPLTYEQGIAWSMTFLGVDGWRKDGRLHSEGPAWAERSLHSCEVLSLLELVGLAKIWGADGGLLQDLRMDFLCTRGVLESLCFAGVYCPLPMRRIPLTFFVFLYSKLDGDDQ